MKSKKQSENRPPEFPRPSSSLARNMLKSRLIFGVSESLAGSKFDEPEVADAVIEHRSVSFAETEKNSSENDLDNDLNLLSVVLGNNSIAGQVDFDSSVSGKNSKSASRKLISTASLLEKSHGNMNTIFENYGSEDVVNSMINGDADFCYIQIEDENPFKFAVTEVPKSIRTNKYSTLSKHGILRRATTGTDVEYVSLARFLRENGLFNKLLELNVFRQFRIWKTFRLWHRTIKESKISRHKRDLEPCLAFLDPDLQNIRCKAINLCFALQRMEVLRIEHHLVYDITEFADLQRKIREQIDVDRKKMKDAFIDDIKRDAEQYICRRCEGIPETKSNVIGTVNEPMPAFEYLSYTERAKIRVKCRKLSNLLRSFDFMIRDYLYCSVEISLNKLRKSLELSLKGRITNLVPNDNGNSYLRTLPVITRSAVGVFRATATLKSLSVLGKSKYQNDEDSDESDEEFEDGDSVTVEDSNAFGSYYNTTFKVTIEPVKRVLIKNLLNGLKNTLATGTYTHSLLLSPVFEPLLMPIANSETRDCALEDLIYSNKNNSLHLLINECVQLFKNDLGDCMLEVDHFSHFADKYSRNTRYLQTINDMSSSLKQNVSSRKFFSPEVISSNLTRLKAEMDEIKLIEIGLDIGCIHLELAQLQNSASKQISNCLNSLNLLTPQVYLSEGSKLYNDIYSLRAELISTPNSLDDFVRLMERYSTAVTDRERLASQFEYVMLIKDVINEHQVHLSDDASRQHLTLSNVWHQYNEVMESFRNNIEENTNKFSRDLKNRVKALQEPMEAAENRLNSDLIKNPDSDPDVVLEEIELLSKEFAGTMKLCRELEHFQNVLNVFCLNSTHVNEMVHMLNSHKVLWEVVKMLKDLYEDFVSCPNFLNANCFLVDESVRTCLKRLLYEVDSDNPAVRAWIDGIIAQFHVWTPIIKHLQSSTLQNRHIDRMHKATGRLLLPTVGASVQPSIRTVKELMEMKINENSTEIERIYLDSVREFHLESKITECMSTCSMLEFTVFADKENKNLFQITNLGQLLQVCEDISITLQSALHSAYIAPHLAYCEKSLERAKQFCKCLQLMEYIQTEYLKFKILFVSTKTARYLGPALRHYKIVDDCWRNVLKVARNEYRVSSVCDNDELCEQCVAAFNETEVTLHCISSFAIDQCMRWPKLFLCSVSQIAEFLTIPEPLRCFSLCGKYLFPNLTGLILPDIEKEMAGSGAVTASEAGAKVIGVSSYLEEFRFRGNTSVTYKSAFVDWIRGMDSSLSEKLLWEFKEAYISDGNFDVIVDLESALTGPTTPFCDQNRLNMCEVLFWKDLDEALRSSAGRQAIVPLHHYLNDSLAKYTTFLSNCIESYVAGSDGNPKNVKAGVPRNKAKYLYHTAVNLLLLKFQQRDLLKLLLSDYAETNSEVSFSLHCSIKKRWNSSINSIAVQQGIIKYPYGFKYLGFDYGVVVTPLTEKCMLSLSLAFQDFCSPFMCGATGSGKSTTVKVLSNSLGSDMINLDCSHYFGLTNSSALHNLHSAIRAAVGGQLWLNFTNADKLPSHIFANLLTQLSVVRSGLVAHANFVTVGTVAVDTRSSIISASVNQHMQNQQITRPKARFSLCYSSPVFSVNELFLPPVARKQFRPIFCNSPSRRVILDSLLAGYNFHLQGTIAGRLDALCEHIIKFGNAPYYIVNTCLFKSVREVGITLSPSVDIAQFTLIVARNFLSHIHPLLLGEQFNDSLNKETVESNLKYIYNTFLEAVYTEGEDNTSFYRSGQHNTSKMVKLRKNALNEIIEPHGGRSTNASFKKSVLQCYTALENLTNSVIVYGRVGSGKTTVIKNSLSAFMTDYNAVISALPVLKDVPSPYYSRVEVLPNVINPWVMLNTNNLSKESFGSEFLSIEKCCASSAGALSLVIRVFDSIIEKISRDLNCLTIVYVDFPIDSKNLSTLVNWTSKRTVEQGKDIIFVWECVEIRHLSPDLFASKECALLCVDESIPNLRNSLTCNVGDILRVRMVDELSSFRFVLDSWIGDDERANNFKDILCECVETYLCPCAMFVSSAVSKNGSVGIDIVKSAEEIFSSAISLVWKLIVYYLKKPSSFVHSNTSSLCPNPISSHLASHFESEGMEEEIIDVIAQVERIQSFESPASSPMRGKVIQTDSSPTKKAKVKNIISFHELSVGDITYMKSKLQGNEIPDVFDVESIQRLFVYSSIWTFGVCSSNESYRKLFENWFGEYFDGIVNRAIAAENEANEVEENTPVVCSSKLKLVSKSVFPGGMRDIYDYYLLRPEEGSKNLRWISFVTKWRMQQLLQQQAIKQTARDETGAKVKSNDPSFSVAASLEKPLLPDHAFSTELFVPNDYTVLIPTGTMQNCRILQKSMAYCSTFSENADQYGKADSIFLSNNPKWKYSCANNNHLLIYGESGSGKSALLYSLACDKFSHGNRWLCYLSDNIKNIKRVSKTDVVRSTFVDRMTCSHITSGIISAKSLARPRMIEGNYVNAGSIFVDDLNINPSAPMSNFESCFEFSKSVELLRYALENKKLFDYENRKFAGLENTLIFGCATTERCNGSETSDSSVDSLGNDKPEVTTQDWNRYSNKTLAVCTVSTEMMNIMGAKYVHSCSFLKENLCDDLITLTCSSLKYFLKNVMYRLSSKYENSDPSAVGSVLSGKALEYEMGDEESAGFDVNVGDVGVVSGCTKTLVKLACNVRSGMLIESGLSGLILLKPISTVIERSMNLLRYTVSEYAVVTANEVLKIWDKILSTYADGFLLGETLWSNSVEEALQDYAKFSFPQFSDTFLRIQKKRLDTNYKMYLLNDRGIQNYSSGDDNNFSSGVITDNSKIFLGTTSVDQVQSAYLAMIEELEEISQAEVKIDISPVLPNSVLDLMHNNIVTPCENNWNIIEGSLFKDLRFWSDVQKVITSVYCFDRPNFVLISSGSGSEDAGRPFLSSVVKTACKLSRWKFEECSGLMSSVYSYKTLDINCSSDLKLVNLVENEILMLSKRIQECFTKELAEIEEMMNQKRIYLSFTAQTANKSLSREMTVTDRENEVIPIVETEGEIQENFVVDGESTEPALNVDVEMTSPTKPNTGSPSKTRTPMTGKKSSSKKSKKSSSASTSVKRKKRSAESSESEAAVKSERLSEPARPLTAPVPLPPLITLAEIQTPIIWHLPLNLQYLGYLLRNCRNSGVKDAETILSEFMDVVYEGVCRILNSTPGELDKENSMKYQDFIRRQKIVVSFNTNETIVQEDVSLGKSLDSGLCFSILNMKPHILSIVEMVRLNYEQYATASVNAITKSVVSPENFNISECLKDTENLFKVCLGGRVVIISDENQAKNTRDAQLYPQIPPIDFQKLSFSLKFQQFSFSPFWSEVLTSSQYSLGSFLSYCRIFKYLSESTSTIQSQKFAVIDVLSAVINSRFLTLVPTEKAKSSPCVNVVENIFERMGLVDAGIIKGSYIYGASACVLRSLLNTVEEDIDQRVRVTIAKLFSELKERSKKEEKITQDLLFEESGDKELTKDFSNSVSPVNSDDEAVNAFSDEENVEFPVPKLLEEADMDDLQLTDPMKVVDELGNKSNLRKLHLYHRHVVTESLPFYHHNSVVQLFYLADMVYRIANPSDTLGSKEFGNINVSSSSEGNADFALQFISLANSLVQLCLNFYIHGCVLVSDSTGIFAELICSIYNAFVGDFKRFSCSKMLYKPWKPVFGLSINKDNSVNTSNLENNYFYILYFSSISYDKENDHVIVEDTNSFDRFDSINAGVLYFTSESSDLISAILHFYMMLVIFTNNPVECGLSSNLKPNFSVNQKHAIPAEFQSKLKMVSQLNSRYRKLLTKQWAVYRRVYLEIFSFAALRYRRELSTDIEKGSRDADSLSGEWTTDEVLLQKLSGTLNENCDNLRKLFVIGPSAANSSNISENVGLCSLDIANKVVTDICRLSTCIGDVFGNATKVSIMGQFLNNILLLQGIPLGVFALSSNCAIKIQFEDLEKAHLISTVGNNRHSMITNVSLIRGSYAASVRSSTINARKSNASVQFAQKGLGIPGAVFPSPELLDKHLDVLSIPDLLQTSMVLLLASLREVASDEEYQALILRLTLRADLIENSYTDVLMRKFVDIVHNALSKIKSTGCSAFSNSKWGFNMREGDSEVSTEEYQGEGDKYTALQNQHYLASINDRSTAPEDELIQPDITKNSKNFLEEVKSLLTSNKFYFRNFSEEVENSSNFIDFVSNRKNSQKVMQWVCHLESNNIEYQLQRRREFIKSKSGRMPRVVSGLAPWDDGTGLLSIPVTYLEKLCVSLAFKPVSFSSLLKVFTFELGYHLPNGVMSTAYILTLLKEEYSKLLGVPLISEAMSVQENAKTDDVNNTEEVPLPPVNGVTSGVMLTDNCGVRLDINSLQNSGGSKLKNSNNCFLFLSSLNDVSDIEEEVSISPFMDIVTLINGKNEIKKQGSIHDDKKDNEKEVEVVVEESKNVVSTFSLPFINVIEVCGGNKSSLLSSKFMSLLNSCGDRMGTTYSFMSHAAMVQIFRTSRSISKVGLQFGKAFVYSAGSITLDCGNDVRLNALENFSNYNSSLLRSVEDSLENLDSSELYLVNLDDKGSGAQTSNLTLVDYSSNVTGVPTIDNCTVEYYLSELKNCLNLAQTIPITVVDEVEVVVIRVRWLLALYHSAVMVRCKQHFSISDDNRVILNWTNFIGDETYLSALRTLESVIVTVCGAGNSKLPEDIASVQIVDSRPFTSDTKMSGSDISTTPFHSRPVSSAVSAVSNSGISRPGTTSRSENFLVNVQGFPSGANEGLLAVAVRELNYSFGYVVECIYSQAVMSLGSLSSTTTYQTLSAVGLGYALDPSLAQSIVRNCFNLYFTPGCYQANEAYFLQGHLEIPNEISSVSTSKFIWHMKKCMNHNFGFNELIGAGYAEINRNCILHEALPCFTKLKAMLPALSNENVRIVSNLSGCAGVISQIISKLSKFIFDLSTSELNEKMKLKSSVVALSKNVANPGGAAVKQAINRRRQNPVAVKQKPASREFDPMWTFLLTECKQFNQLILDYLASFKELSSVVSGISVTGINLGLSCNSVIAVAGCLLRGVIPSWFLSSSEYSINREAAEISIQSWTNEIEIRWKMLLSWLQKGHPHNLQLEYLMNPSGLLQALLECHSWRNNVKIDGLSLDLKLIDIDSLYKEFQNDNSEDVKNSSKLRCIEEMEQDFDKEFMGCVCVVHGVKILNALWNESKYSLEFPPRYNFNVCNQELALRITVVNQSANHNNVDDYHCPLFIRPAICAMVCRNMYSWQNINKNVELTFLKSAAFLKVEVPTMESVDECSTRNVSLCCGGVY